MINIYRNLHNMEVSVNKWAQALFSARRKGNINIAKYRLLGYIYVANQLFIGHIYMVDSYD